MCLNQYIYSILILTVALIHQSYLQESNKTSLTSKNVTVVQKDNIKDVASEGGIGKDKTQSSSELASNPRINTSLKQNNSVDSTPVTIQSVSFHQGNNTNFTQAPQETPKLIIKTDIPKAASISPSPNVNSSSSKAVAQNVTKHSTTSTSTTTTTTTTTATTTTEVARKPNKTTHDEFDPKVIKSELPLPNVSNLDSKLSDKNIKRANYVVPIVAVILSVPLVAYIMSILYKRGSDWWQHRNYRRMDYLIEGMYNS